MPTVSMSWGYRYSSRQYAFSELLLNVIYPDSKKTFEDPKLKVSFLVFIKIQANIQIIINFLDIIIVFVSK